jgi:hypothetical protein
LLLSTRTQQLEEIFKKFPKPLKLQVFYLNSPPILLDISHEVQKLAIQNGLSRVQIMALETLRSESFEEYQKVTANSKGSSSSVVGPERKESAQIELKDLRAREMAGEISNFLLFRCRIGFLRTTTIFCLVVDIQLAKPDPIFSLFLN